MKPSGEACKLIKEILALTALSDEATAKLSPLLKSLILKGQPFDQYLIKLSPLYRKSRTRFLSNGGTLVPALLSSPRSLSSASLLENEIEYSPLSTEYIWAATDQVQKQNPEYLIWLRGFITNTFHEQNHRVLWNFLPAPPSDLSDLQKYLNFAESLVVVLDMALSDQIGKQLSEKLHTAGVLYDRGTDIKKEIKSKRSYFNYLHACAYGTYLNLEGFPRVDIIHAISYLYSTPNNGATTQQAAERSLLLDREFIEKTNPNWQQKHYKKVLKHFAGIKKNEESLSLPDDPLDHRLFYLWTEKWLELFLST
jgi:hypothetical protein